MVIKGHRKSEELGWTSAPSCETTFAFIKTSMVSMDWNPTEVSIIERRKTNLILYWNESNGSCWY